VFAVPTAAVVPVKAVDIAAIIFPENGNPNALSEEVVTAAFAFGFPKYLVLSVGDVDRLDVDVCDIEIVQ